MKTFSSTFLITSLALTAACTAQPERSPPVVIASPEGTPRPPFTFSDDDEAFLDEVQHGAFLYFWNAVAPETGMVYDRTSNPLVSTAGVGFQLSALPIGVERGWVTRQQAEQRALLILRSLEGNPTNRHAGLFQHYIDGKTGGRHHTDFEQVVSTVDSALFFAGALTASSYFGGEVAEISDRLFEQADWAYFTRDENRDEPYEGFISLGWRAPEHDGEPGQLLRFAWCDSGDEHRLVTFLAACAPEPEHRVPPETYYRLRRLLGEYGGSGPMVYLPFSGALFTAFFSHCWIDYASMGPDDPASFGVNHRARVDWWENSRRLANMHRAKAVENPEHLKTPGPNAWGLTACDAPSGYTVPGLFPDPIPMPGARPDWDTTHTPPHPADKWHDGTIAPYGAGSSIMFEPKAAVAALRHYRALTDADGAPLVWRDPAGGGFGFLDAYCLQGDKPWADTDCIAIDQGPLILAIENARTGLIWRLFRAHSAVQAGMERLGMSSGGKSPGKGGKGS